MKEAEKKIGLIVPTLYTSQEVAAAFGVDKRTVQRWARSGKLRSISAGRNLKFTQEMVDEFLKESRLTESQN